MAITLTDQVCLPPPDDGRDDWLDDGEGVHTALTRDWPTQLNNLGTYCNNWAQYMQTVAAGTSPVCSLTTSLSGEFLIFQCPIVVPPGALAMQWTAGVTLVSGTGSILSSAVYLSQTEYTRVAQATPFEAIGVSQPAGVRSQVFGGHDRIFSCRRTVALFSAGYKLVRDTEFNDGGIASTTRYTQLRRTGGGLTLISNLIFTLTCESASSLVMGCSDFTCWFLYE